MKLNERVWAGQLISWIQETIRDGKSIFQDATNDAGIKLESGRTKFPDILLFTNKVSGIIFNGWELKFPDTDADDEEMLINALEKAERIKSDSFVTWNGSEAIIWKINNNIYSIDNITAIKVYPKEININSREDLTDPVKFKDNEPLLRKRLNEILHDLEQMYERGELKPAINISENFIVAVKDAADLILPQFTNEIKLLKGKNRLFRQDFNEWKIYESSTLKILASSSRRAENVKEEEVLAKFTFYNLLGKIIFYLTLSENLSGSLKKIELKAFKNIQTVLNSYFELASRIDYQAVFKPYFTDQIKYSLEVSKTLFLLFNAITEFDFKVLPSEVIGTILENLVPQEEKQKFGQYFTPPTLANLVAFPAVQTVNDYILDPTSGTGTFLNSFYQILSYHGNVNHGQLLNQIWGNDISHFPAILSVISLYKQRIKQQIDNFPRVTRDDYFNFKPNMEIAFPDSNNYERKINQRLPAFDSIVSNFPFIEQEEIPNDKLTNFFKEEFETSQKAFLKDHTFKVDKRSDYFTYCIYNSIRFLKKEGFLSAITSNAWLGKDYGLQFKKFLLDNFHIKYIVKTNAEHWFSDSKVSTIYSVFQLKKCSEPTKFITLNFKLNDFLDQENINKQLKQIEDIYSDIDTCSDKRNINWEKDRSFDNLFYRKDKLINVSIVSRERLLSSITSKDNWDTFFISPNLFSEFDAKLIQFSPKVVDVFRGERTGWNSMFVIPSNKVKSSGVAKKYLIPYVKSPAEFYNLEFKGEYKNNLFVCEKSQAELKHNNDGTLNWINKFKNRKNKNGTKTIQSTCSNHKPFWYSLKPKKAHIVTAINPYERYFFCFSENPFVIDQRLIAFSVKEEYDVELVAALLNSVITYLTIEMRGTSRNLGALDLNANYFKNLRILDPDLLSENAKKRIKKAFQPLKGREIKTIYDELKQDDRINFDKTILKAYGVDEIILSSLYHLLLTSVNNRVSMKDR